MTPSSIPEFLKENAKVLRWDQLRPYLAQLSLQKGQIYALVYQGQAPDSPIGLSTYTLFKNQPVLRSPYNHTTTQPEALSYYFDPAFQATNPEVLVVPLPYTDLHHLVKWSETAPANAFENLRTTSPPQALVPTPVPLDFD